jgi:hypothetical protein
MKKRKFVFGILMVALFFASSITFFSCYPNSSTNVAEFDVTITLHVDDLSTYSHYRKYIMRDSIIYVNDGSGGSIISRANDDLIRSRVIANLADYGYTRITNPADTASADVVIVIAVTNSTKYVLSTFYPGGYWGYGYWGGWYMPWTTAYSFSTGTVLTTMVDKKNYQPGTTNSNVVWMGILNGVNDGTSSTSQRVSDGINKCFSQSPYLKVN